MSPPGRPQGAAALGATLAQAVAAALERRATAADAGAAADAVDAGAATDAGAAASSALARRLRERARTWRAADVSAAPVPVAPTLPANPAATPLQALRELVARLGHGDPAGAAMRPAAVPAAPAGLRTVAAHQGTWARLRTQHHLRQALAEVPPQAGPLHTSHLVYRALRELQALSPAYLEALTTQMDTLMTIEQRVGAVGARAARAAPRERRTGR